MRVPRILLGILAALAAACALGASGAAAGNERAVHYYLSLGDSLAAGYQPPLGDTNFGDDGYADQLYALEAAADPTLKLVKLGCGGETTGSMIDAYPYNGRGGHTFCRYPHGSQLAEAVNFLHAHRGFVSLVTLDIGANDVLGDEGVEAVVANLPVVLRALREAAGPGVPVVGMNYYNPFVAEAWGATHSIPVVLGTVAEIVAFNDVLEAIYGAAGMPVANVEAAFSMTNVTLVGGVPLNVVRVCQWTWMCAGPPFGPDIHANDAGYGVIAHAFRDVLHP
jgi:lysophospholipase L1-like esterase